MSALGREMQKLARQGGGSHKTVHDRLRITERLGKHLLALNIQVRAVKHLKSGHIEAYMADRLSQGISPRTLQNEMAAIPTVLREAGRHTLVQSDRLSNRALGLSGASRVGTRAAITTEHYQHVLSQFQHKDAGLAATLELARLMGLRSEEAVRCSQSLRTWSQALARGD